MRLMNIHGDIRNQCPNMDIRHFRKPEQCTIQNFYSSHKIHAIYLLKQLKKYLAQGYNRAHPQPRELNLQPCGFKHSSIKPNLYVYVPYEKCRMTKIMFLQWKKKKVLHNNFSQHI